MDLIPHIYHEKQEAGSMLCAQHALNNLLQSSTFTPQDLADVARRLDQLEADQLDNGGTIGGESNNYDDSGFFSIMVLEDALKVFGLRLVRWKSKEMKENHDHPERMEGFVLNHQLHWYTIRRFASHERFYNLDSMIDAPEWISPMYLGLQLREAEIQGYSIFAVVPTDEAAITGLPSCTATDIAPTLPSPLNRSTTRIPTTSSFSGKGHSLSSKRPPPDDDELMDEGGESASSVEEQSESRRRRVRYNDSEGGGKKATEDLSEEDQMALAIAASLSETRISEPEDEEEDDDEIVIVESSSKAKGKEKETRPIKTEQKKAKTKLMLPKPSSSSASTSTPTSAASPAQQSDEDRELEAALKASLEEVAKKSQSTVEENQDAEEDDNPTVEELRRRRLARFGG